MKLTPFRLSAAIGMAFGMGFCSSAAGGPIVVTGGDSLLSLDTASSTPSVITTIAGQSLDSVVYYSSGSTQEYVVTTEEGNIYTYDPTNGNRLLASGFGQTRDLVLDPGNNSFLVSDYLGNEIYRVNLASGSATPFAALTGPQGLAYAGNRLFALDSNSLLELDPTSGAILNSVSPLASDGLTYDSYSGKLWTSSSQGIKSITLDLSTVSAFQVGVVQPNPDGLAADGTGNLFIAGQNSNIYQYAIASDMMSVGTSISGLDDVAPASGLGAPPGAPEPATIFLAAGALGILALKGGKLVASPQE